MSNYSRNAVGDRICEMEFEDEKKTGNKNENNLWEKVATYVWFLGNKRSSPFGDIFQLFSSFLKVLKYWKDIFLVEGLFIKVTKHTEKACDNL